MPHLRFFEFLIRSFFVLKMENRSLFNRLVTRFGSRKIWLHCDEEVRLICVRNGNFKLKTDTSGAGPQIWFSKSIILDLIDAKLSIQDALLSDQLRVKGALEELDTLNDCLFIYLHAAIRSGGMLSLLNEFRRDHTVT